MNDLGQLSADEIKLVLLHRETAEAKAKQEAFVRAASRTFGAYHEWLSLHRRGTSFSTFVDEFGYQAADAADMYAVVSKLLDHLVVLTK